MTELATHLVEIVAATPAHIEEVYGLARHLNTVNLPHDRAAISRLLSKSEASFSGAEADLAQRTYVFLLRRTDTGQALATSSIVAQLGTRLAPYVYFDVRREEKYSRTLDRHFEHTILETTYSYSGPTELAGLVVDPAFRGSTVRCGTIISYVRFLFIGIRRGLFRQELLAELLPPLRPDGTSWLWDAVGKRFTGLTYAEADRLSRTNKEFIKGLFPQSIYATLLDPPSQAVIGEVGMTTRPVRRMLESIGFRYASRVDPFDGGPHFLATTDQVSLVKSCRPVTSKTPVPVDRPGLLATMTEGPPYLRCVPTEPVPGLASRRSDSARAPLSPDTWWMPTAMPREPR